MTSLIDEDPELDWSVLDYVEMKDETNVTVRFPLIAWRGTSCFWWYRDQIIRKNPDQDRIAKLIRIGGALGAQVFGDDGERYVLHRTLFGRDRIRTIQPE